MAFDRPSPVTELTQELRLATTMTGGVSLAIWMAGVAREINLLAQASQWRRVGKTFPAHSRLTKESAACLKLYANSSTCSTWSSTSTCCLDKCRWHQRSFACFVAGHGV